MPIAADFRWKLLWIRNTLDVVEVECSEVFREAARQRGDLEVLCEPRPLPFDAAENLPATVQQIA